MDIRRVIPILIGVILISFGIGFYSLRYYDNITFDWFRNNGININGKDFINVRAKNSDVKIGKDGIQVKDGEDYVSISWDGIFVKDGDEQVSVGWDGIKVKEGNNEMRGIIDIGSWFGINTRNLTRYNIDEEKTEDINGVESIKISSSLIDIKVIQENREDIRIKYYGTMKSNVLPKLETSRKSDILEIKLTTDSTSHTVTDSNVVLEVIIPQKYENDIKISSSSANIFINDIIGTNFNIASSSGNIDLNNIKAQQADITTSSGNMYLSELGSNCNITSSSGNVNLSLNNSSGDIKIVTSSGNVSVGFDADSSYNVSGTTSSGNVRSSRFITVNKDKSSKFELSVGSGEKEMKITTSSGDVYFK